MNDSTNTSHAFVFAPTDRDQTNRAALSLTYIWFLALSVLRDAGPYHHAPNHTSHGTDCGADSALCHLRKRQGQ